MAVFGPIRGLSSAASFWHSWSTSGSLVKVLLQDQLRGHRVDGALFSTLLLHASKARLRFNRRIALVDARDRQLEALLEAAREILGLASHRMGDALDRRRQANHQRRGLPLVNQFFYLGKNSYCGKRMHRAELGLAHGDADALETEIEC